jgi:hypothetical protein
MLSREQISLFDTNGYLVVEDVLDHAHVIDPIRREYSSVIDDLYDNWIEQGKVSVEPECLSFESKLLEAHAVGCDWFQPMDISLPGDKIFTDTPAHFGLTVFDLRYHVTGQPSGRQQFLQFVARSQADQDHVIISAEEWRMMWEDARDRLAQKPHIDIHRWSGDAPSCA